MLCASKTVATHFSDSLEEHTSTISEPLKRANGVERTWQSDQEVEGIRLHAQLSRICLRLDLCRSCVYGSGQAVTTVSWYVKTPCSVHRNDFSVFIYLPCYCSALRGWLAEVYTVPLGLSILQSFVSTFRQPWVSVLIIMRSKQAETRVYPCL